MTRYEGLTMLMSMAMLTAVVFPAFGQDASVERRGEQLLSRDCAMCHAIGHSGTSSHPAAPLFRTLEQRYPIESRAEALGEGLLTGHSDMPECAIIAYLQSIQKR